MAERLILHCDLNNFYASVEVKHNPALTGKPVAVAGDPKARHGVILAKNDLAKAFGVKTGEAVWEAKQKAPGLILVLPHFEWYTDYSRKAFAVYNDYTDMVEPFGADECWLDCTGSTRLFGSGETIAETIRQRIKRELGLTISVGVSFNKIFAKLGSDYKKPDAVTVINRQNFRDIVWPLPVNELFMIGRKTAEKLSKLNLNTIGALAAADEKLLVAHFGINGRKMRENALGLDAEPVREAVEKRKNESIGHGMTATRDITAYKDADALLYYLSDRVAARLKAKGFTVSGVRIDLRSSGLKHVTRQTTLNRPIYAAPDIAQTAGRLLREIWPESPPLRTVTVQTFSLNALSSPPPEQLDMFTPAVTQKKSERLFDALSHIRNKYGDAAILRGDLIESDFIYDKSDDEDFLPFQR